MRYALSSLTVVVACLSTACLQQETSHTVYLSHDGAITWTSIERDVRSDARDPVVRSREEQEFLERASGGRHPVGLALQQLGPDAGVRTRLLRRERPYAVVTEARFIRIDLLIDRLLQECGVNGFAVLTREGAHSTLQIAITVPDSETESGDESPVLALADVDSPYRVVLTEGRFVSGTGFRIEGDGAVAALETRQFEDRAPGEAVMLSLSWE